MPHCSILRRSRRWSDLPRWPALALALTLGWADPALAQVEVCKPTPVPELDALVDEAESLIALVEYGDALSQLESLESLLPCAQDRITTEQLVRMNVYRGVTLFYLGNEQASVREFGAALAIDPTWQWDDSLGDRPRVAFDEAAQRASQQPAQQAPGPELREGVMAVVDGHHLLPGEEVSLKPGTHLLQYRPRDGEWEGRYFTVHPNSPITLPVPQDLTVPPPATPAPADPVVEAPPVVTPEEDPPREPRDLYPVYRATAWGGGVVTAAGFVTLTIGGTQYLATKANLYENYHSNEIDETKKQELEAEIERNARFSRMARAGLGITAAGVVVTGVSAALAVRAAPQRAAQVSPLLAPGAAGVLLSFDF